MSLDELVTLLKSLGVSSMKAYRVRNALAESPTFTSASTWSARSSGSPASSKVFAEDSVMTALAAADLASCGASFS
jgi:hypothetical protein